VKREPLLRIREKLGRGPNLWRSATDRLDAFAEQNCFSAQTHMVGT
jgi:hypothetical protein